MNSKSLKTSIFVDILKGMVGLIFLAAGVYLVKKNNKEGTKPLRDIQTEQYLGCLLIFIGALPLMEFILINMAFRNVGNIMNEMF